MNKRSLPYLHPWVCSHLLIIYYGLGLRRSPQARVLHTFSTAGAFGEGLELWEVKSDWWKEVSRDRSCKFYLVTASCLPACWLPGHYDDHTGPHTKLLLI